MAEVCSLVDRNPLGIRLAAERLPVVGLDRLRTGLTGSLELVPGLADAVRGSVDALDAGQRLLVQSLAVFAGPVPLDAAEAVGGAGSVDLLVRLVQSGLVRVVPRTGAPAYDLPHPVRLVARSLLESGDLAAGVHTAVADFLLDATERWSSLVDTAAAPEVLGTFADVAVDVEAAVGRALAAGQPDPAAALCVSTEGLWIASGRLAEGQRCCEVALSSLPPEHPSRARVQAAAGRIAYHRNDWSQAEPALRSAIEVGERTGDAVAVASARCFLAATLLMTGRAEDGRALAEVAITETEALDLYPQSAQVLSIVAIGHAIAGDLVEERATYVRRLALVRQHGDVVRTADTLDTLAQIDLETPEVGTDGARRYAEEALALAGSGFPAQRRDALLTLARAAAGSGSTERVRPAARPGAGRERRPPAGPRGRPVPARRGPAGGGRRRRRPGGPPLRGRRGRRAVPHPGPGPTRTRRPGRPPPGPRGPRGAGDGARGDPGRRPPPRDHARPAPAGH